MRPGAQAATSRSSSHHLASLQRNVCRGTEIGFDNLRLKGGKKNKEPDPYAVYRCSSVAVPDFSVRCRPKTRYFSHGPDSSLLHCRMYGAYVLVVYSGGLMWRVWVRGMCVRFWQDIQAPKRALTAYMIFSNRVRPELMKQNPEMKITEVSKHIAERWKVGCFIACHARKSVA